MSSSLWTTEANGYLTFCVSVAFLYSVIFCFFNCDFLPKLSYICHVYKPKPIHYEKSIAYRGRHPAGKCRFGAKLRKEHPGRPRRTEPVELLDFGRRCVHQHRLAGLVPRRRDRSDPALQQTTLLPRNRACLLEPRRQGRRRELPPLLPANPRAGELPLQHQGHRYDPTLRRSLLRARHRRQSEGRRREGRHLRRRRRVETFRSGRASGRRRRLETHLLRTGLTTSAA